MKLHHTPEAAAIAGVTERQIDHWCRVGIAHPTRPATGSGSRIGWSREDVAKLTTIGRLARLLARTELPKGIWSLLDELTSLLLVAIPGSRRLPRSSSRI